MVEISWHHVDIEYECRCTEHEHEHEHEYEHEHEKLRFFFERHKWLLESCIGFPICFTLRDALHFMCRALFLQPIVDAADV